MGKRLHVAKTYVVEYGDTEAFNWSYDKFYDLLQELNAIVYRYGSEDDDMAGGFEVTKESYEAAMKHLKQYAKNPKKLSKELDGDGIRQHLDALGMEAEVVLDIMQSYYKEAHMADGYLHFAAW